MDKLYVRYRDGFNSWFVYLTDVKICPDLRLIKMTDKYGKMYVINLDDVSYVTMEKEEK